MDPNEYLIPHIRTPKKGTPPQFMKALRSWYEGSLGCGMPSLKASRKSNSDRISCHTLRNVHDASGAGDVVSSSEPGS